MKAKEIPIVKMVRCEVTGKIVPLDECEYVVIKILKHRDADINNYSPFPKAEERASPAVSAFAPNAAAVSQDTTEADKRAEAKRIADEINRDPNKVALLPEEMAPMPKRRNVIPPAMLAVMKPAHDPGAATEVRTV